MVEHILHHITDIGLHFTDIDNWGLTNASRLFNLTKEAIELGYYNVNQYEEINEAGIRTVLYSMHIGLFILVGILEIAMDRIIVSGLFLPVQNLRIN